MVITATKPELRKYAWVMTGALSFFGTVAWLRDQPTGMLAFFSVAGLFLFLGLVLPMALRPAYIAWMTLAHVLAWINTRLILGLFYYAVMTPVSLGMRLFGRDTLGRKFDRSAASYWQLRQTTKPAKERFEHLF